MLHESYDLMDEHKHELAEIIWEGMNQDRILGPCPKCSEAGRKNEQGETNRLRIIRAKKSGKRFVGCEGYPDCDQTYGIPQRGDLIRLEEACSICGKTPRLKVLGGRRPWNLCLNDECPSMEEMRRQRAEREAARAAKEAAERAAEADGETAKRRKPRRSQSRPAPQGAGPQSLQLARCSSPSRESTAPARRRRPGCSPRRSATRPCWCASRAGRRRRSASASWSRRRELSPMAETLLFGAARADLIERVIRPALEAGKTVICDRYVDSTVAYQGGARGLGIERVEELNRWLTGDLWPDVTFLLDVDPGRGEQAQRGAGPLRAGGRGSSSARSRPPTTSWRERHPDRYVRIDGTRSAEEVHADVLARVRAGVT